MDFYFDIENPLCYLAYNEELGCAAVRALKHLEHTQGKISKSDIDNILNSYGVNYFDLPKSLIQEIDSFNI